MHIAFFGKKEIFKLFQHYPDTARNSLGKSLEPYKANIND